MRSRASAIVALLLLIAGCSGESVPHLPLLPEEGVVLALGNSLTYGSGASPEESYPAVLSRLIGREVINAGLPGETTDRGRRRFPELLDEVQPDLVILIEGGNDFLRRYPPEETKNNLARMIEEAQSREVAVVLVAVPKPGLLLGSPPLYRELAEQYGLPLEEEVLLQILGQRELKSDPVHPNGRGYRKLAEAICHLLKQTGAIERERSCAI